MLGRWARGCALATAAAALMALLPGVASAAPAPGPTEIVVGGPAAEGAYPWVARLSVGCAGSLIAPRVVLTAGHCVRRTGTDRSIGVRAGSADLSADTVVEALSTYVRRAPGYRRREAGYRVVRGR